jgi:hypothetical protein
MIIPDIDNRHTLVAVIDDQMAWRSALGRLQRDAAAVEAGLRAALDARGLTWSLRRYATARAARDVWAALTVLYASRIGWISDRADLLTVGLRDAYGAGLGLALPTGTNELGWAMDGDK